MLPISSFGMAPVAETEVLFSYTGLVCVLSISSGSRTFSVVTRVCSAGFDDKACYSEGIN